MSQTKITQKSRETSVKPRQDIDKTSIKVDVFPTSEIHKMFNVCHVEDYPVVDIWQLLGWRANSSRMISPHEGQEMLPVVGFLMDVTGERIVALTDEYSNARSASGSNVQSSRIRFSQ